MFKNITSALIACGLVTPVWAATDAISDDPFLLTHSSLSLQRITGNILRRKMPILNMYTTPGGRDFQQNTSLVILQILSASMCRIIVR